MRLTFDITTPADALVAAAAFEAIAAAMSGETPAPRAARRTRATAVDAARAPEADKLVDAYNAVAAKMAGTPTAAEPEASPEAADSTATLAAVSQVEMPPQPVTVAFDRAAVESAVKAHAISKGVVWLRDNILNPYRIKNPKELTDDQLREVAALVAKDKESAA